MGKSVRHTVLRHARKITFRQILSIFVGLFLLWGLSLLVRGTPVHELIETVHDLGPIPFFLAMTILPLIGFPVTPFYFLAGATFGVGLGLILTAISQAINLSLAYWLSRRYLHDVLEKLIRRTNYTIPEVTPKHHVNFTLLVRITPGPPHFLKSFILGLARVPFGIYFLISWTTTMGFAVGVIVFGDSLVDRDLSQAILGFVLMVVFLIGIKITANIYNKRQNGPSQPHPNPDSPPSPCTHPNKPDAPY